MDSSGDGTNLFYKSPATGGSGGDESSALGLTWQAAKDGEAEHGGNRGSHSLSLSGRGDGRGRDPSGDGI
jgi:hypothetical protein